MKLKLSVSIFIGGIIVLYVCCRLNLISLNKHPQNFILTSPFDKETNHCKCPKEACRFAEKIKKAVKEKNIEKLFSWVNEELDDGPRKRFVKGKAFLDVFSKKWRESVLKSQCEKIPLEGGYMLGDGKIWFYGDKDTDSWHIYRIYGAKKEQFNVPKIWEVDNKYLTPDCFTYIWPSGDNFEEFSKVFGIPEFISYTKEPGKYITNKIALHGPITPEWGNSESNSPYDKITLVPLIGTCAIPKNNVNSEKEDPTVKVIPGNEIYYYIIRPVPLELCQKLAPKLNGNCISSYMLSIHSCADRCCPDNFGIWGIFQLEPEGKKVVVPLRFFDTENHGLNFIEDYEKTYLKTIKKKKTIHQHS